MTRNNMNIATLYSSAQCVLSVVGSVGVILLFAGIPQLIYSPQVSVANLMTFLLGAILITTMVAGNSFLNYKYRKFTRAVQQNQHDANAMEAQAVTATPESEDKPPSYDAILTLDGLPPDYFSILSEKPPRYEEIAEGGITPSTMSSAALADSAADNTGLAPSGSEPSNTAEVENLPKNTTTSTDTMVKTSSLSPSKSKKEELDDESSTKMAVHEQQTQMNPRTTAEQETPQQHTSVPRLTIGYDNEAYTPEEVLSSSSSSATAASADNNLRESES